MEKDIIYLVTKLPEVLSNLHADKNHAIELWSDNTEKIEQLNKIFYEIQYLTNNTLFDFSKEKRHNQIRKFLNLNLFRQGYDIYWIMLESWSDKEDLMIEFGEFCAKELGLPFDII